LASLASPSRTPDRDLAAPRDTIRGPAGRPRPPASVDCLPRDPSRPRSPARRAGSGVPDSGRPRDSPRSALLLAARVLLVVRRARLVPPFVRGAPDVPVFSAALGRGRAALARSALLLAARVLLVVRRAGLLPPFVRAAPDVPVCSAGRGRGRAALPRASATGAVSARAASPGLIWRRKAGSVSARPSNGLGLGITG